jgi:g-D-glutamyl-meso-diaminopimelate peptidase
MIKQGLAIVLTFILAGSVMTGCGSKESGLTKEQIESYDHSFSNVVGADDSLDSISYDDSGYIICDDYIYVSSETAILKTEANDTSENSVTLYYGDKLYRTGKNDEGWNRVFYDGENLYISDANVTEFTIDLETEFQYSLASLNIVETSRQYYSYDNLCDDLSEIRDKYPDYVTLNAIGNSADDRAVYEVIIGNPNAEKSILVVAGMEGCEYMTSMLAAKLCEYYAHSAADGLYNGYLYSELLEKCSFHIIPMLNPDGIAISQYYMNAVNNQAYATNINSWYERDESKGGTMLSLDNYLMFYYANVRGADLSLNFPYKWDEAESLSYAANSGYKGESEASENETQDVIKIINSLNPDMIINLRTSGDSVAYDFGADETLLNKTKDYADILSSVLTYTLDEKSYGKAAYGSLEGYSEAVLGIPALKISIGSGDAPLSLTEYNSIWNSGRETLIALAVQLVNE